MSEISLILIRHGEASEAWGTNPDPGLSSEGINQAKLLVKNDELSSLETFKFISSPKARAQMTAEPLVKEFKKELIIDDTFSEIPSDNIKPSKKREWLTDIMKMNIEDLPTGVVDWRSAIHKKTLAASQNTIIFTHFMVINSLVAELIASQNLLYFYTDYTSITKLIISDGKVKEFFIGGEKKTTINL